MYKAFRLNLQDIQQVVNTYHLYGQKQSLEIQKKWNQGLRST